MDILTMNQSIFSNKFKERGLSKNARKAMASEMYIPTNAVEMTYDEMECVDGGWFLGIKLDAGATSSIYNSIGNSINLKVMVGTTLFELVAQFASYAFPTAVAKLSAAIGSVIGKITSILSAGGPAGILLGIGLGIVGLASAVVIAGVIIAGANGKGFEAGWEIGLFKKKWQFGLY